MSRLRSIFIFSRNSTKEDILQIHRSQEEFVTSKVSAAGGNTEYTRFNLDTRYQPNFFSAQPL